MFVRFCIWVGGVSGGGQRLGEALLPVRTLRDITKEADSYAVGFC